VLAGPSASARYQSRRAYGETSPELVVFKPATSEGGHPRSLSLGGCAPRSGRRRCRYNSNS